MTPKRFYFGLCGLLAVIVVAGAAGYYLANQALTAGITAYSQKLGDEQVASQQLTSYQDLQRQYQRLQSQVPAITAALPSVKDQSGIALQLHTIAASSGMDLNNLSFTASAIPGPTSQTVLAGSVLAIPITFQLNGTYAQLQQFLQAQETLNRYTSVTSLGIASNASNLLTFSITLNTFLKL